MKTETKYEMPWDAITMDVKINISCTKCEHDVEILRNDEAVSNEDVETAVQEFYETGDCHEDSVLGFPTNEKWIGAICPNCQEAEVVPAAGESS